MSITANFSPVLLTCHSEMISGSWLSSAILRTTLRNLLLVGVVKLASTSTTCNSKTNCQITQVNCNIHLHCFYLHPTQLHTALSIHWSIGWLVCHILFLRCLASLPLLLQSPEVQPLPTRTQLGCSYFMRTTFLEQAYYVLKFLPTTYTAFGSNCREKKMYNSKTIHSNQFFLFSPDR